MPIPDLQVDSEDLLFSDPRPCPIPEVIQPEIISYPEAISAAASQEKVDIRPRIYDGKTKDYILLDTGSMCSVTKPLPDTLRPD